MHSNTKATMVAHSLFPWLCFSPVCNFCRWTQMTSLCLFLRKTCLWKKKKKKKKTKEDLRIYPNYSDILTPYIHILKFIQFTFLSAFVSTIAGWVANSVDPDHTPPMKSNRALDEIQGTVIYSRIILVAVRSECCVKRVTSKTWTGLSAWTLANSADPDETP